mmetsp:Transcript_105129/g.296064  ORF Transcript_105129/g.296064 Transcript_105129/m.296064 type:complete len:173 (-) Transcript_105129:151-669(-)
MDRAPAVAPMLVANLNLAADMLRAAEKEYGDARAMALSWLSSSCGDVEMLECITDILESRLGQAFDIARVREVQAHATQHQDEDEALVRVDTCDGVEGVRSCPPSQELDRRELQTQCSEPLPPHVENMPIEQFSLLQNMLGVDDATDPSPRWTVRCGSEGHGTSTSFAAQFL